MSLYLTVFCGQNEVNSVEVGMYSDFNAFRECVCNYAENGSYGSRFPILQMHKDAEGIWQLNDLLFLKKELIKIKKIFTKRKPSENYCEWKINLINQKKMKIKNLNDSFFDVDGEPLIDRLIALCNSGIEYGKNIDFM